MFEKLKKIARGNDDQMAFLNNAVSKAHTTIEELFIKIDVLTTDNGVLTAKLKRAEERANGATVEVREVIKEVPVEVLKEVIRYEPNPIQDPIPSVQPLNDEIARLTEELQTAKLELATEKESKVDQASLQMIEIMRGQIKGLEAKISSLETTLDTALVTNNKLNNLTTELTTALKEAQESTTTITTEVPVEVVKEVIREVVREVPVEVIKEVIVEVQKDNPLQEQEATKYRFLKENFKRINFLWSAGNDGKLTAISINRAVPFDVAQFDEAISKLMIQGKYP